MLENAVVPFPSSLQVVQANQALLKKSQSVQRPIAGDLEGLSVTRLSNEIGKISFIESLLPQKQKALSTTEGKLQNKFISKLVISLFKHSNSTRLAICSPHQAIQCGFYRKYSELYHHQLKPQKPQQYASSSTRKQRYTI
jgi:hypothetical protein